MNKALSENQLTTSTDVERRGLSVLCAVCGSVPQAEVTRPILFSAPMVKAIRDGRKSQTRRIIKPQPDNPDVRGISPIWGYGVPMGWKNLPRKFWNRETTRRDPWNYFGVDCATNVDGKRVDKYISCPYGKAGDDLWVKESYWSFGGEIHYEEDATPHLGKPHWRGAEHKPGIFMPKVYSRIILHILDIQIRHVQEMSEEDAVAEGMEDKRIPGMTSPRFEFHYLWDSINGEGSWAKNPYVWVVSFKACGTTNCR